jgi:Fuc2NAc and GlcNAc transferase
MTVLYTFIGSLLSALILTWMVRNYALKHDVVDTPSIRSSHQATMPRGGGLSIVVVFLAVIAFLFADGMMPTRYFLSLLAGVVLIGGIGFVDDHSHVPPVHRFAVHLVAALAAIYLVGGLPALPVGDTTVDLGWAGLILATIFLIWLTNLFNFMDGIDGIAAAEAIFIAGAAAVLGDTDAAGFINILLIGLAAACTGFLIWNWPPARIFMGDVGSGFVGFALGVVALISSATEHLSIFSWLILAGVFVSDATVTVIRRMYRGERWYEAHRSHAYQRCSRRLGSHLKVTFSVVAINVVWLLPIAALAASYPGFGWWLTILAWAPLMIVTTRLGAGLPDE